MSIPCWQMLVQRQGLFFLLKKVKQSPCRSSPHSVIRVVEGLLHEGNKFTIPNMS